MRFIVIPNRYVLFPLLMIILGAMASAADETMNWDDEFICYYHKLEQEQHAWNKLNPLTRSLYVFIENRDNEIFGLNSKAPWDFKRLHSLDFKTVLNPHSTGAITVTLYRNEHGQYFIRLSGGCEIYSDELYGPFEHSEKEFLWPKAQVKSEPRTTILSPERDALFLAIVQDQKDEVRRLIKSHPGVLNLTDSQSTTALVFAASLNRTEIAGLLLESHVDPDKADARGFTALMFAVINRNQNLVRQLLHSKPKLVAKNEMGYSVMDYVKMLGWEKEFKRLQELEP